MEKPMPSDFPLPEEVAPPGVPTLSVKHATLKKALLAVDRKHDKHRVLTFVQIIRQGGQVTVTGTNGKTLYRVTEDLEERSPFDPGETLPRPGLVPLGDGQEVLVGFEECQQIIKTLDPSKGPWASGGESILFVQEGNHVYAMRWGQAIMVPLAGHSGKYPDCENLAPKDAPAVTVELSARVLKYLADLARLENFGKHASLQLQIHGPGKPIQVTLGDGSTLGVVMPIGER